MTAFPDGTLTLTATTTADGVLCAALAGDLVWESADELLDAVRARLSAAPGPSGIRLDCARMTLCDSTGLSALLALHRAAEAAGIPLRLDRRPPFLDRLLLLTGTYGHLTGLPGAAGADREADGPGAPAP